MADWRKLAKAALLANNTIDDRAVAILRRELFTDKRIERGELEFLLEARQAVPSAVPAFDNLVCEAVRTHLLTDGQINAAEVAWLRNWMFADNKVSDAEKKLLKELKLLADQVSPEFQALYDECMAR